MVHQSCAGYHLSRCRAAACRNRNAAKCDQRSRPEIIWPSHTEKGENNLALARGIAALVLGLKTSALARLLPDVHFPESAVAFGFKLVVTCTQFSDSLFGEQLFQRPLLDILRLVLFQLSNELDCALQDGAFVLFTARDDLRDLIDTLIYCLSTTSFDWGEVSIA